ncbi:MAG: hypothetical protein WC477_06010 [Patescibacteria group bacterium]
MKPRNYGRLATSRIGAFRLNGSLGSGDAVAAQVIAGKTFSNDDDTDIIGTMSAQTSYTTFVAATYSAPTLYCQIPLGAYLDAAGSGYPEIMMSDSDMVATNIKSGVTIFGLAGTLNNAMSAGTTLVGYESMLTSTATTSTTYVKLHDWTINFNGTYRTNFALKTSTATRTAYATIYKNGTAFGTERITNSESGLGCQEDLAFAQGDEMAIYAKIVGTATTTVTNFYLQIDVGILYTD